MSAVVPCIRPADLGRDQHRDWHRAKCRLREGCMAGPRVCRQWHLEAVGGTEPPGPVCVCVGGGGGGGGSKQNYELV